MECFPLIHLNDHDCINSHRRLKHHSEPVLCIGSHSPKPRLHRQSLLEHDEFSVGLVTQAPLAEQGMAKLPMRRKISLGNLFFKPSCKVKIQRRSRDPSPPGTLASRPDAECTRGTRENLASRVRSRSAPFNEMSPIQENLSDSPTSCSAQFLQPPKSARHEDVHILIERSSEEREPPAICFISSSDESYASSDSELGSSLLPISLDPPNVVYATAHPPTPDVPPVLPCPFRSPRPPAAPLSEILHGKPSPAAVSHSPGVNHGSTPTSVKPSPCTRRSSDSEITVTPKGFSSD